MEFIKFLEKARKRIEKSKFQVGNVSIRFLWADSLGAKSFSVFIETPDARIVVDPGAAAMQPSYPIPDETKRLFRETALKIIKSHIESSDIIVITHYHYDHFITVQKAPGLYRGKKLLIKNPNIWINDSQRQRAFTFVQELAKDIGLKEIEKLLRKPSFKDFHDPVEFLHSRTIDFGDYQERRDELLKKGKIWLERLIKRWRNSHWLAEFSYKDTEVFFADDRCFKLGSTQVRFTAPLFHGIEYDRTGWVIALVVETPNCKLLYTSDLQGPQIEDYADWIISENPDILIADGPPTYLLGYMVNQINLNRAVKNFRRIIKSINAKLIVYDHHLLRDKLYRKRAAGIYALSEDHVIPSPLTVAELIGLKPLMDYIQSKA